MCLEIDGQRYDKAYCAIDCGKTWIRSGFLYLPITAQRHKETQRILLFMSTELARKIHRGHHEVLHDDKVVSLRDRSRR